MLGIFDSGVGGLTVVKELKKHLPNLPFIYLGDNARSPYGSRGEEIIRAYAEEDARFLIDHGVDTIIIACNTASAFAGQYLREKFPAIKIWEVITPAAEAAIAISKNNIGIIGTRGTINSRAYENKIHKISAEKVTLAIACPLFVPLVEENFLAGEEIRLIANGYLRGFDGQNIDALILGCTHYPLIRDVIGDIAGPQVRLIDPAEEVVRQFILTLTPEQLNCSTGLQEYYSTDPASRFAEIAEDWLKEEIEVKKAVL